jgi:hypothetical protein
MGAALVAVATMKWAHVSNDAYRVLTRMAVVAHDRESAAAPARRYFGGHDGLIDVLGYGDCMSRATKLRRVREAIAELIQVGAIACEKTAVSGRNAVYELTLDALAIAAKPKRVRSKTFTKQQAHSAPTEQAHVPPTREAHSAPTREAHCAPTPYKEEELLEDSYEERFEDRSARSSDPPALRVITGTTQPVSRFIQPPLVSAVPSLPPTGEQTGQLTPGEQARIDIRRLLSDRKRGRASA